MSQRTVSRGIGGVVEKRTGAAGMSEEASVAVVLVVAVVPVSVS